ncbi:hypothetical protein FRC02_006874 [Tulasnella sp. 418]|nr:hypothetical protein FRC02_006874 [Tulasnella sp. 418]
MGGKSIMNLALFDDYSADLQPIVTKEMMVLVNGLTPEVPIPANISTTGGHRYYI